MKNKLKILIPIAILIFLIWTITRNWLSIYIQIQSANFFLLFLSGSVLLFTHIGGAFFWHRILKSLSAKITFKEAFRIFVVSNFGRFIPGVIVHYIARVYLLRNLKFKTKDGVTSVFFEAYYTLVGAMIVSIFALPLALSYFKIHILFLSFFASNLLIIIFIMLTLILVLSLISHQALDIFLKVPFFNKFLPRKIKKRNWKEHVLLLTISSTLFLLDGAAFFLLSSAFIQTPINRVIDLAGLFSASWIVGFLTPIAPGGLGVSDLSFAFLLQYFYNFSLASFLVILFRFNLLFTEGIAFLFVIKLFGFNVINPQKKIK